MILAIVIIVLFLICLAVFIGALPKLKQAAKEGWQESNSKRTSNKGK